MKNKTIFSRLFALCLACVLAFGLLPPTAQALTDPTITAGAAILINPDNGIVLYEKNADGKMYPASTTKIMTALLVLENVPLTDVVTAEDADFAGISADSSNADIKVGEKITVLDLLYCLMLPSANESANMLARHVSGSVENFVTLMNEKAAELGCSGTHFANPNGLHDENHYTTARDLCTIANTAMQNETFAEIANTAQKTISATNMHEERKIFTTNMLIYRSSDPWYYVWCKGIKTGHTSQAGNCLVSYAEQKKSRLLSVVLKSSDAPDISSVARSFTDTKTMFEWGYENFTAQTLAEKGTNMLEVPIRLSTETDHLALTVKEDLVTTLPNDVDLEDLKADTIVPDDLVAPVKAGDVIGTRTYSYNGVDYGTVELVALTDVSLSKVLYYADKLENFFSTTAFKVILLIVVVFVVLYILFNLTFGRLRRRRQNKMMHSRQSRYRNRK